MHDCCHDLPLKLTWASSSPKGREEEKKSSHFSPVSYPRLLSDTLFILTSPVCLHGITIDKVTTERFNKGLLRYGGRGEQKKIFALPTPLKTLIPKALVKRSGN